jgi:hypothetical protein
MKSLHVELQLNFGREVSSIRNTELREYTRKYHFTGTSDMDPSHIHRIQEVPIRSSQIATYLVKLSSVLAVCSLYQPDVVVGLSGAGDEMVEAELMTRREFAHLGGLASMKVNEVSIRRRGKLLSTLGQRIAAEEKRLSQEPESKKRKCCINVE